MVRIAFLSTLFVVSVSVADRAAEPVIGQLSAQMQAKTVFLN